MTKPFLAIGAVAGYALLMWMNPLRPSLRDGLRALRRYPALWAVFGLLGCGYACFDLSMGAFAFNEPLVWSLGSLKLEWPWSGAGSAPFWSLPPGALASAASEAILPALDATAGIFNNLVSTFPLSVFAAVALVLNAGGRQRVLLNALLKRYGRAGWIVHAGVFLCAIAASAKPILIFLHRSIESPVLDQWSQTGAWLAFLFEYLLGVYLQVYLILLSYCWVRGISFKHAHLADFAIRRSSFVLRWAVVVLALSSLLIDFPLILSKFPPLVTWLPRSEAALNRHIGLARAAIDGVLLLFASMQITLTFHSETLRGAWTAHWKFVARHFPTLAWLLVTAALNLYFVNAIDIVCRAGFGERTPAWVCWRLAYPWFAGMVGGWLLASWVCVFKRCEEGLDQWRESIPF